MERQMMPTEDGVAPPWNRTNPSPATPGVLTARCYTILHHLANKLLEYSRGGGTGPAGPVLAGPLFSDQVINIHKLNLTR